MSVYIDNMQTQWRGMKFCHMIADTLDELHKCAEAIGLRSDWFQGRPVPHYDVCKSKRKLAVKAGAKEVTRRQLQEHIDRLFPLRKKGAS